MAQLANVSILQQLLQQLEKLISPSDIIALFSGQPVTINVGPISDSETIDVFGKKLTASENVSGSVTLQLQ